MTVYSMYYHSGDIVIGTRWYPTIEAAQAALEKRIGSFVELGCVCGDIRDAKWNGEWVCTCAPRNGGSVNLERKQA